MICLKHLFLGFYIHIICDQLYVHLILGLVNYLYVFIFYRLFIFRLNSQAVPFLKNVNFTLKTLQALLVLKLYHEYLLNLLKYDDKDTWMGLEFQLLFTRAIVHDYLLKLINPIGQYRLLVHDEAVCSINDVTLQLHVFHQLV